MGLLPTSKIVKECRRGSGHLASETRDFSKRFRKSLRVKSEDYVMTENLISKLVPHQGCVITRTGEEIEIAGSAMNWVMSAAVAPLVCRAPFTFRVVGKTDS